MVSTFTPNINLEEPARGDDVGTWDTPVNSNMTVLDLVTGANTTVGLGSGNVTLATAQYRSRTLTFNSTMIQNTTITFPSTFIKDYVVGHVATGSSAFTVTLQTTVSGGQVIALPPGEYISVLNDGANLKFTNLGRVGGYEDFATTAVPAWITACTVPPYLACAGGTFSATTYPQLAVIIGSSILPDLRGRTRAYLNQGTGRMTTANGGVDGNTLSAGGGADSVTLTTAQIPSHSHGVSDPGHVHQETFSGSLGSVGTVAGNNGFPTSDAASINTLSAVTGISIVAAGGGGLHINMQPTAIGGITMIRAA